MYEFRSQVICQNFDHHIVWILFSKPELISCLNWMGQHPNFDSPRGFTMGCLAKTVSGEEPRGFNCIPFIRRVSDPSNIKGAIERVQSGIAPWGRAKPSVASATGAPCYDYRFIFSVCRHCWCFAVLPLSWLCSVRCPRLSWNFWVRS